MIRLFIWWHEKRHPDHMVYPVTVEGMFGTGLLYRCTGCQKGWT